MQDLQETLTKAGEQILDFGVVKYGKPVNYCVITSGVAYYYQLYSREVYKKVGKIQFPTGILSRFPGWVRTTYVVNALSVGAATVTRDDHRTVIHVPKRTLEWPEEELKALGAKALDKLGIQWGGIATVEGTRPFMYTRDTEEWVPVSYFDELGEVIKTARRVFGAEYSRMYVIQRLPLRGYKFEYTKFGRELTGLCRSNEALPHTEGYLLRLEGRKKVLNQKS